MQIKTQQKIKTPSKITKWGNSYGLRLPKDLVATFSDQKEISVEIVLRDRHILEVRELKKNNMIISVQTFVKAFRNNDFKTEVYDWGKPKGKEIW